MRFFSAMSYELSATSVFSPSYGSETAGNFGLQSDDPCLCAHIIFNTIKAVEEIYHTLPKQSSVLPCRMKWFTESKPKGFNKISLFVCACVMMSFADDADADE